MPFLKFQYQLYIFSKEDLSDLSDLSFHSASNRSDNEGGLSDVETREDPTFSFASGNPENQNPQTNETIPYLGLNIRFWKQFWQPQTMNDLLEIKIIKIHKQMKLDVE